MTRRYGRWAGNPAGTLEDPLKCIEEVHDGFLQAKIEREASARKKLEAAGFTVTYFPMEGEWLAFKDHRPVGNFHPTISAVLAHIPK